MSKGQRVRPPKPDVNFIATFEANNRNLGDCRNISYTEMYRRYQDKYAGSYSEHELRRIHLGWKRIMAEL